MKFQNKNILLISPETWNHIFVSKHHYATHLAARGNKVFFLNPSSSLNKIEKTDFQNVFSVQYKGFIKGLRFMPTILQRHLIRQKFKQLQKLCEVKFQIIWSFDNSVFFDFSALPNEVICISHIVDLNQDFEFIKTTQTADICLSTTSFIEKKQKRFNCNSFNIGHGYNLTSEINEKIEISEGFKYRCGYAGNLDIQYIDWELIEKLLINFPEVGFYFAGNWERISIYDNILSKTNFFYLGKLSSQKLKAFYASMDLLLLVYKYQEFPEQLANPHKMLEYLGSGKMIAATWTEEYKNLHEKEILMSKDNIEFINRFRMAIIDLSIWNSAEKVKNRIDLANDNTYFKQLEKIEKLLN